MGRVPRRLKRLNLNEQRIGHHEGEEETSMFNSEHLEEGDEQFNGDTVQLNLEDHEEGNVQIGECNEEDQPDVSNGEVRHVLGDFKVKNLEQLKDGKVFVETDENGVPNDKSGSILGSYIGQLAQNSTFAPLHIPRWNDKLFLEPQKSIITDVEMKFVYPSETMQLTRDWILMKASKGWRSYKYRLKKKFFNPDERSLSDILKDVPEGVNEFQWAALLSMWTKEQHMKLCEKNSECAKQQKNPHTTGRKSHARLCKEMMEARKGEKVHDIDVWDEAHRKKDPQMKAALEMAYNELANRKTSNSGNLSSKDYDDVFRRVVGKKTKLQGYYDHKNWIKFSGSQGSAAVGESEHERELKLELKKMDNKVEHLTDEMSLMRAFIETQFPGADWRNILAAGGSRAVDTSEQADGHIMNEFNNNIEFENISFSQNDVEELHSFTYSQLKGVGNDTRYVPHEHTIAKHSSVGSSSKMSKAACSSVEPTMSHVNEASKVDIFEKVDNDVRNKSTRNDSQDNEKDIPQEHTIAKQSSMGGSVKRFTEPTMSHGHRANKPLSEGSSIGRSKTSQILVELTPPHDYGTNEGDIFYQANNGTSSTSGFAINLKDSHAHGSTVPRNVEKSSTESSAKRPQTSVESILSHDKVIQVPQRKRVQPDPSSRSDNDPREVYLFSLHPAYKGKIVAKGNLVTTDSTCVVGGNMLGDEYYGVAISAVTSIGDERMPRPFEHRITVRDAIGCVIAWPRFYIKKPKTNPAR